MPKPSWEDMDVFFQTDEDGGFAIPAVFVLQDGTTRTVSVIFDDPEMTAELGGYVAETSDYKVTGPEDLFVGIDRMDRCVVAGKAFDVLTSPRPDGTGTAKIMLAPSNDSF